MICIFLNPLKSEFRCHAQPIRPGETGILYYKPTENELKKNTVKTLKIFAYVLD